MTAAAITIRPARASDVDQLDRLLGTLAHALGDPGAYAGDVDALRRHGFGEPRLFHALLAERGGVAIGLCVYFPEFSTWRCAPGVYVQDLVVAGDWRGDGIGFRLLAAAARDAGEAWDARYMRLAVHAGNRGGRRFYRATGFAADPDSRVMVLDGDPFAALARDAAGSAEPRRS